MAVLKLVNGKDRVVPPEIGVQIWDVLTGKIEPDEEQAKFCLQVERVFLNWRSPHTPEDYLDKHKAAIMPIMLSYWMVDSSGKLSRPEPSDGITRELSKRWGLLVNGWPSTLAHQIHNQNRKFPSTRPEL